VPSSPIIDLVIKQRDVTQTTALVITHRIQDAYLLARSRFNTKTEKVEQIPNNGIDDSTKFLVLNEGKVVFDGTTEELVHSNDPWLKEYLS
jgi:phospholipid/cholesterol/gamma-HCH transport system ATP-binding protein